VSDVVIREPRPGDGEAVARLHVANSARYAELAPELFRLPDEEGLVDFLEARDEFDPETMLALVAEVDGEVAGYLEAQLQPPLESARWQSGPDLGQTRLFVNAVGTAPEFQRRGVATRLVEAAEAWGRERGATVALCDTWLESPFSVPFWTERMGYERRAVILRKRLD
jgi:GNAT superfamily N-acetyltransferase